jgi:putative ABC transport system permease protein
MFTLVWHNLRRRQGQTLITIVTVGLAVGLTFFAFFLSKGLENGLQSGLDRLGADIIVLPTEAGANLEQTLFTGVPMNIYMPAEVVEKVRQTPGVIQATPQFFAQTLDDSCCSLGQAFRLVGIEQETDFVLKAWLETNLQRDLAENEMILGGDIPAFVGDQAEILNEFFVVAGQLELTGASIDNTIFLPIDKARSLAANSPYTSHLWDRNKGYPEDLVSAVLVKVDHQALGDVVRALHEISNVNIVTASQVFWKTKQQLNWISLILGLAGLLLGLVCFLALFSRFSTIVLERKREVGILRSLGATKLNIFSLVIWEAVLTGIIGGAAGLAAGILAGWQAKSLVQTYTSLPYLTPPLGTIFVLLAGTLGFAVMLGIVASLIPAYRCASLDPVQAITQGELE